MLCKLFWQKNNADVMAAYQKVNDGEKKLLNRTAKYREGLVSV